MSLVRWEPERRLLSLRDAMDRLFEESFVSPVSALAPFNVTAPALDVYQTDESVVVQASLPGMKAEEMDISVIGDVLTIKGETRAEKEIKEEDYIRRERRHGSFCRSISLPTDVNVEKAEAKFEHGVLTLTLPKAEAVKPKAIKVKNGS